jgi:hypothetical protein
MNATDRVIEGKKERQRTMDKLSIKSGRAYTYDTREGKDSGCPSKEKQAKKRSH